MSNLRAKWVCSLWLCFLLFAGECALSEQVLSPEVSLTPYLHADFFSEDAVPVPEAPQAAAFAPYSADVGHVQAQLVCLIQETVTYEHVTIRQQAVSGVFTLAVDADGICLFDPYEGYFDEAFLLDRDDFGKEMEGNVDQIASNRLWTTGISESPVDYGEWLNDFLFSANSGFLEGFTHDPEREQIVYIVYSAFVERFLVTYCDADGNSLYDGRIFGLPGADLGNIPDAVKAQLPPNPTIKKINSEPFTTDNASLWEPTTIELSLPNTHLVSFLDGETLHDKRWINSGESIDMTTIPDPPLRDGWIFTGWYAAGADTAFSGPVNETLSLHAHFQQQIMHEVALYADPEALEPYATLTIADGEAIDFAKISRPASKQHFLGLHSASGTLWDTSAPVKSPLALYARLAPAVTAADVVIHARHVRAAFDTRPDPGRQAYLLATPTLHYDASRDDYFLDPATLPLLRMEDTVKNQYLLDTAHSAWAWRYEAESAPYPLTALHDRWYLGESFDPTKATSSTLLLTYEAEDVVYQTVYYRDAEGILLPGSSTVLTGGSLRYIEAEGWTQDMLPEASQPLFMHWLADGGTVASSLRSVDRPIVLTPRLKQRFPVQFYLDEQRTQLYEAITILEGEPIDWSQLGDPQPQDALFQAWQLAEGEAGAAVTSPRVYTASLRPYWQVRFCSRDGALHATFRVLDGDPLPTTATPPARKGLSFSHWQTSDGGTLDPSLPVTESITYTPQYLATVQFYEGKRLTASYEVPEGGVLGSPPQPYPSDSGYVFAAWDGFVPDMPIMENRSFQALYDVEITFVYGLYGETWKTVRVRQGEAFTPPDASVQGYVYRWSGPIGTASLMPTVLSAAYTALPTTAQPDESSGGSSPDDFPIAEDAPALEAMLPSEWITLEDAPTPLAGVPPQAATQTAALPPIPHAQMPFLPPLEAITQNGRFQLHPDDIPLHGVLPSARSECAE